MSCDSADMAPPFPFSGIPGIQDFRSPRFCEKDTPVHTHMHTRINICIRSKNHDMYFTRIRETMASSIMSPQPRWHQEAIRQLSRLARKTEKPGQDHPVPQSRAGVGEHTDFQGHLFTFTAAIRRGEGENDRTRADRSTSLTRKGDCG